MEKIFKLAHKQNPAMGCLQENYLKQKDSWSLKIKLQTCTVLENCLNIEKVEVAFQISDVGFKKKKD